MATKRYLRRPGDERDADSAPMVIDRLPRIDNASQRALIRGKVMAPGMPSVVTARPRVDALFAELLKEHDVVGVFAVAGSGKTVQAQLFARQLGWPLAWLTLDSRDRSHSRMLSYLAASLEPIAPEATHIVEEGFAKHLPPEEIAALLAEGIPAGEVLVVIDQCEVLADHELSEALLASFLDYLPRGVHTILLGRAELPASVGHLVSRHRMGRVLQQDLALTEDEATELALAQGQDVADAAERCRHAGGWMAAVAFGGSTTSPGLPATRDFFAFLGAEIFGVLSADERRFLLDTAILDEISLQTATALCGPEAGRVCRLIQGRHLPATTMDDGTIVLHPCFRDFLLDRLAADEPARLAELQRRYAEILLEAGKLEEATELLLSIGDSDAAAGAAEMAVSALLGRGDWTTVLRWLESLGPDRVSAKPVLLGAKIRALRRVFRLEEARTVVRDLDQTGKLAEVLAADPGAISYAAGSMLWHPKDGLALLDRFDNESRATGIRYMLEVISGVHPARPPSDLVWAENERLVSWALMLQGRLRELVCMLPADEQWPPRNPHTSPHPMAGLLWRGEVERVRDLFNQVTDDFKDREHSDLWLWFESSLLLVEGRADSALICAERAAMHSRRSGSSDWVPVYQHAQAQALLALGQVDQAFDVLDSALAVSQSAGLAAYEEWCKTVLGRALLMKARAPEAVKVLRQAVRGMSGASRHIFLPMAAAYLSEAEWRTGNEDASDTAAALAYSMSERTGGFTGLRMALQQFPSVLHRQLDLGGPSAEHWRHLKIWEPAAPQAAIVRDRKVKAAEIQPFGPEPDIIVDDQPMGVGRLKVMELACYVAAHRGGVRRDAVQTRVFPDSDRRHGSNYFRQVVHQLRKTTGLTFQRLPNSFIDWSPDFVVDTLDARFERMVMEARAVAGEDRFLRLLKALEVITGPYLPASELGWVADRSFRLDALKEDAELEVANLAVTVADFSTAASFAERILAANPSNPAAYKTLLEVEISSGTKSGAMAVYRRAQAALRGSGLSLGPEVTTRLSRHLA